MVRVVTVILALVTTLAAGDRAFAQDAPPTTNPTTGKVYRILPIGDSITQGSGPLTSYRFPLWEKLHAAGYFVEYVGSRESATRIGSIKHEGWSGHTAEFFAKNIEEFYGKDKADFVLLHSGHNHDVAEKPIPSILASTETIVSTVRRLNPNAIIFVAQVITSGKLPKYSYIPELNDDLAKLVTKLDPEGKHVILVNQADGWDYTKDCVADMVHPNQIGADKMAQKWFDALAKFLPASGPQSSPKLVTYKKIKGGELQLHVFDPPTAVKKNRPAIVYFFGGGWSLGTPLQFYAECRELAADGVVAISADYRIASINQTTPYESLADAKSAIRWIRQHTDELGIDPNRIAAAGSSAGGHLAAAAAMTRGFDEPGEDLSVSCVPNALVLLAPVINNGPDGFGFESVKEHYKEFSPYLAVSEKAPPTIMFLGDHDKNTPLTIAQDFQSHLQHLGGQCDLKIFTGFQHGLFSYREPPSKECLQIRHDTAAFLKSIGYIK